jgi:hypothetical protein
MPNWQAVNNSTELEEEMTKFEARHNAVNSFNIGGGLAYGFSHPPSTHWDNNSYASSSVEEVSHISTFST